MYQWECPLYLWKSTPSLGSCHYLTRARPEQILERRSSVPVGFVRNSGSFRAWRVLKLFMAGILWTACQIQRILKQTESDNCRLQVCSFYREWGPCVCLTQIFWWSKQGKSFFAMSLRGNPLFFWESKNMKKGGGFYFSSWWPIS